MLQKTIRNLKRKVLHTKKTLFLTDFSISYRFYGLIPLIRELTGLHLLIALLLHLVFPIFSTLERILSNQRRLHLMGTLFSSFYLESNRFQELFFYELCFINTMFISSLRVLLRCTGCWLFSLNFIGVPSILIKDFYGFHQNFCAHTPHSRRQKK